MRSWSVATACGRRSGPTSLRWWRAALQTTEADQTIGEAEGWLLLTGSPLEQQQRADETLALVRDWLEAGQHPSWPEVSA